MIFRELILQNFGPYLGKNIIKFVSDQEDNSAPIILFGGMNGGGKTTLMDAIRLTLYGQRGQCSTRGNLSYNDFLLQCINSHTPLGEKTRIELEFEHIINDKLNIFRIVRYWDKTIKDGKDNLGILNQDWLDKGLVNTWDEYIETILPLGISNLFLFDGEQVKELADQDIPTPAVVNAIKSLLGLELAERLDEDLDILATRKRKELTKTDNLKNLQEIEEKLKALKQEYTEINSKYVLLQDDFIIAEKKEREMSNKFQLEGGKIAGERSSLQLQINSLEQEITEQRQEMIKLASRCLPLGLITPLLKQAKIQGEKEIQFAQAKLAQEVLKLRDERFLSYLAQLSLKPEDMGKIKDFLVQENEVLSTKIDQGKEPWLKIEMEQIKQIETILDYQLPLQINQVQTHQKKLKAIEIDIENHERQLAVAASPEAYETLSQGLNQAKEALAQAKIKKEKTQKYLQELEQKIKLTTKELNSYTEDILTIKNSEHILQSILKVKQTLEQFREKLTLNKLNKLEGEITECFRYLLHKSNLVHRVIIDTQTFGLSLYDNHSKLIPKNRLSAGEKQLLAIAFLWGLARVSGRNLPVAIDTPLGRLDSSHRHNLVERYFPTASHQVILLSTDTEIDQQQVEILRKNQAIALEYLLVYNPEKRQTTVKKGYFWEKR
jgi:DNA sulfur modification protein DndD